MTKVMHTFLAGASCALLLTIPLAAADSTAAKVQKNATKAAAARSVWPQETLSGRITMVDPDQKLVVVQTEDGVPYDIDVTARTLIESGDHLIALKDLTQDVNQTVSVTFIPERRGDVARKIQIQG